MSEMAGAVRSSFVDLVHGSHAGDGTLLVHSRTVLQFPYTPMSVPGQTRHFDRAQITSGLL
jgi:hypothetical protein